MQTQHEESTALLRDLEIARAERDAWRAKLRSHLSGLKAGMDREFQEWGMNAAEQEVSLLILKDLSHKGIASLWATSEATVRQQVQAIYRKAGSSGKTAFSAYFLEDLFAPDGTADQHAVIASEAGAGVRTLPPLGSGTGETPPDPPSRGI